MLVEDIQRLGPLGMGDGDRRGRGIEAGGGHGVRPQFLNTHPVAGSRLIQACERCGYSGAIFSPPKILVVPPSEREP